MPTVSLRFVAPDDPAKFRLPGDPRISPDGRRVLCTVRAVEGDKRFQHPRVDDGQYTLRREAEFLRFPEENRGLSRSGRPDRRLARLEFILRWREKHL